MRMRAGEDEAGARSQRQRRRHRGADATTAAAWCPRHHTHAAATGRLPRAPLSSTVVGKRCNWGVKGRDGARRSRTGWERRSICGARFVAGGDSGDVPLGTSVCCCLGSAWGSANASPLTHTLPPHPAISPFSPLAKRFTAVAIRTRTAGRAWARHVPRATSLRRGGDLNN